MKNDETKPEFVYVVGEKWSSRNAENNIPVLYSVPVESVGPKVVKIKACDALHYRTRLPQERCIITPEAAIEAYLEKRREEWFRLEDRISELRRNIGIVESWATNPPKPVTP